MKFLNFLILITQIRLKCLKLTNTKNRNKNCPCFAFSNEVEKRRYYAITIVECREHRIIYSSEWFFYFTLIEECRKISIVFFSLLFFPAESVQFPCKIIFLIIKVFFAFHDNRYSYSLELYIAGSDTLQFELLMIIKISLWKLRFWLFDICLLQRLRLNFKALFNSVTCSRFKKRFSRFDTPGRKKQKYLR